MVHEGQSKLCISTDYYADLKAFELSPIHSLTTPVSFQTSLLSTQSMRQFESLDFKSILFVGKEVIPGGRPLGEVRQRQKQNRRLLPLVRFGCLHLPWLATQL